jgi:hypothetical protein
MSDFELPEEAQRLIDEVARLEGRAQGIRKEIAEAAQAARQEFETQRAQIDRDRATLEALIESRGRGYALVAEAWKEYELALADVTARFLESEKRAAPTAADTVRSMGEELAEARRRAKIAEYVIQLYEWHFPWLTELRDASAEETTLQDEDEAVARESPQDPVERWLSTDEFRALESADRNQLALDRYLRSRKTNWQLGRDYERYVGYSREQQGCTVTYQGMFAGLEDLGRDVLAERDARLEVIQCKRWSREKKIHEKHVFQLYGTVVLAKLENPEKGVIGTFTTTTALSGKAREVAAFLGVRVEENFPMRDYPRIKCNIARTTGDRIYHLPFDQQYDTTAIEPHRGEYWAMTCAEAESLGFRRAWRWRAERSTPQGPSE